MLHKASTPQWAIDRRAFTLVELLLAMIIFAVIALSLYNMFSSGIKLDSKARYIHQTYHQAQLAFELITKELNNAVAYDFSVSYPKQQAFDGQQDRISFLLPTDEGIKRVQYYLALPDTTRITKTMIGAHHTSLKQVIVNSTEEDSARVLIREEQLLTGFLAKSTEGIVKEIIATGIQLDGFKCQYASLPKDPNQVVQGKEGGLIWAPALADNVLPQGVKVSLSLHDPSHPQEGVSLAREIFLLTGENQ